MSLIPRFLVVRNNNDTLKTVTDLIGYKVAVINGFATANVLNERFPGITHLPVKNVTEALKSVFCGSCRCLSLAALEQLFIYSNTTTFPISKL